MTVEMLSKQQVLYVIFDKSLIFTSKTKERTLKKFKTLLHLLQIF